MKECAHLIDVAKLIAKQSEDYLNLYDTLPTQEITDELAKLKRKESVDSEQRKHDGDRKKLGRNMKTLEDLLIVLVRLVTGAKSDSANPAMAAQRHTFDV